MGALFRAGIARYRHGRFQVFTAADGIPVGGIRCIYEDRHRRLWIGSGRGGLGRIDDPTVDHLSVRRYSSATGLASDEIQAITEDNFGRIYAGTGLGVDRIDPVSGSVLHFTKADGLAEGEVQDAMRAPHGDLWFGTYHGVSRLRPSADPVVNNLPVRIASVKINGRQQSTTLGSQKVRLPDLPPGSNGVEIEFLALATSGPNNLRYQYRLGDAPWSAPTSFRTVTYSNLRPGPYQFEVRTFGDAREQPATVQFLVQPHFWETWPFFVSLVAVSLAILYTIHRYRIAGLLRMQQMRTRIANDLHDDIGSGLSKIVILSEVARRDGKNSHAAALDRIAETSREVLDAVGDLVWTTNARAETMGDLVRRMRSFATQMCEAKEIEFEMQTLDLPFDRVLSAEVLRHLYLIFKEAVNNAARHSQCARIQVVLQYRDGRLILKVADDGIGFTIDGIQTLKQRLPGVQFLVLTSYDDDARVFGAMCAGACGYLLKKTPPVKLLDAITELHNGGAPMSPQIARQVVNLFRNVAPPRDPDVRLTPKETQVLQLLVEGHSYKTAAYEMNLTIHAVSFHARHVYEKLHVHSKSEAVAKALKNGIV